MKISIIIPARNEAENIARLLQSLQVFRKNGHELILVDGRSEDDTTSIAIPFVDKLIQMPAGRAMQMNAGAGEATGDVLWFLHVDSVVPEHADKLIINAVTMKTYTWGRFDIRLSGRQRLLRLVESSMNLRSRLTGIATGDQGVFVSRGLFYKAGGFPQQSLMEDIALSKHLKKYQAPICLREKLETSSRRWEQRGIIRTILLMWRLRMAYFLGVPADKLALHYD
ncbi:MAG: TIGR04283 family arsenosugar biosynthesis glycosyltransferase [Gammaproteobacteria bacterium]|nr:MAG: TIGR04283 family arsenosugar biosynthesis glycosyltransferase [Gammaproteobacteria bacterium]